MCFLVLKAALLAAGAGIVPILPYTVLPYCLIFKKNIDIAHPYHVLYNIIFASQSTVCMGQQHAHIAHCTLQCVYVSITTTDVCKFHCSEKERRK